MKRPIPSLFIPFSQVLFFFTKQPLKALSEADEGETFGRKKTVSSQLPLPETNSSPLKIGRAPIGKDRFPTIHF